MRSNRATHVAPRRAQLAAATPLELTLQFGRFEDVAKHRTILRKREVVRWIGHALEGPAEIAVRIVGNEESRALNLQYRRKDYATNVLTFGYSSQPVLMADLVLCGPVIEEEARQQRKPLRAHYAHLLVHGTLHAQGWDHETGEHDALEMEALEILLLGALGFANPY
jgi:probable rRNA maturation factor